MARRCEPFSGESKRRAKDAPAPLSFRAECSGVEESLDFRVRHIATPLDLTRILQLRRTFWVIASVVVLLFAIANLPWQLDDYDQAKQAFTSFQMVKEGRWLYQQTPHQHVATKPP